MESSSLTKSQSLNGLPTFATGKPFRIQRHLSSSSYGEQIKEEEDDYHDEVSNPPTSPNDHNPIYLLTPPQDTECYVSRSLHDSKKSMFSSASCLPRNVSRTLRAIMESSPLIKSQSLNSFVTFVSGISVRQLKNSTSTELRNLAHEELGEGIQKHFSASSYDRQIVKDEDDGYDKVLNFPTSPSDQNAIYFRAPPEVPEPHSNDNVIDEYHRIDQQVEMELRSKVQLKGNRHSLSRIEVHLTNFECSAGCYRSANPTKQTAGCTHHESLAMKENTCQDNTGHSNQEKPRKELSQQSPEKHVDEATEPSRSNFYFQKGPGHQISPEHEPDDTDDIISLDQTPFDINQCCGSNDISLAQVPSIPSEWGGSEQKPSAIADVCDITGAPIYYSERRNPYVIVPDELVPSDLYFREEYLPSEGDFRNQLVPLDMDFSDESVPSDGDFRDELVPSDMDFRDEFMPSEGDFRNELAPSDMDFRDEFVPSDGDFRDELMPSNGEFRNEFVPSDEDSRDKLVLSDKDFSSFPPYEIASTDFRCLYQQSMPHYTRDFQENRQDLVAPSRPLCLTINISPLPPEDISLPDFKNSQLLPYDISVETCVLNLKESDESDYGRDKALRHEMENDLTNSRALIQSWKSRDESHVRISLHHAETVYSLPSKEVVNLRETAE